ncbi:MAG: ChpI protein [Spirochaetes bacterium]|nr:MAG: ChpI protein [Spirochaetota bacterium]
MKTAISIPDNLFAEAEETAKSMGIPRSQLFAKALEEFLNRHKRERITEKLNEVYSKIDTIDTPNISTASLDSMRELTKNDTW